MLDGLMMALHPSYIFWLTVGVMVGMVVGALPGLTATMGTALLVPFTFALPTGAGLAMLGGLYVCAMYSDAIPACLVNTPGTPVGDGHRFRRLPHDAAREGDRRPSWRPASARRWERCLAPRVTFCLPGR